MLDLLLLNINHIDRTPRCFLFILIPPLMSPIFSFVAPWNSTESPRSLTTPCYCITLYSALFVSIINHEIVLWLKWNCSLLGNKPYGCRSIYWPSKYKFLVWTPLNKMNRLLLQLLGADMTTSVLHKWSLLQLPSEKVSIFGTSTYHTFSITCNYGKN